MRVWWLLTSPLLSPSIRAREALRACLPEEYVRRIGPGRRPRNLFFFFWCSDGHCRCRGFHPARLDVGHREEMRYAPAALGSLVWDSSLW
jgi:hypothetical protein